MTTATQSSLTCLQVSVCLWSAGCSHPMDFDHSVGSRPGFGESKRRCTNAVRDLFIVNARAITATEAG